MVYGSPQQLQAAFQGGALSTREIEDVKNPLTLENRMNSNTQISRGLEGELFGKESISGHVE